jgi:eukaryotic-like serine/threonine-protein kinase
LKSKVRLTLVIAIVLIAGLLVSGCVSGLAPIGWSGGTVSGGRLYIGSEEGRLVAVNLADESRQWSEAIQPVSSPGFFGCSPATGGLSCGGGSAGVPIYGTPVVSDNLVFIAGYNGKIYAYNTETLAPRWVYPREGYVEPFVGGLVESGGRLFVGGADGHVYALDAATGDRLWEFATGDKIWATPVVDGDTLYIGSFDKNIYALNTADGREKWRYTTDGSIMATPLVDGGTVYIGSFDRYLYALSAADGSLKWRFQGENWFWARPVVSNGNVYAGGLDTKIYVLRADTGSEVNRFDVTDGISADPVVVDGKIIFATRKGALYSMSAPDRIDLLVTIDGEVYGPLMAFDGVVYVHLPDKTVQRVNAATGALLRPLVLASS